ncbi:head-tail joining protein [Bacillus thuringiensis Sbt003]|uniref:Head-tail joining protein n=49 Tax=cellular organisms TaxID=131567 RepID=A0A9X0JXI3_BACTU|nr:head-tail joining protein [Bacillus thuringiensis Sbt003]
MADFDNLFDAAIARADETIRGYMGTSATITSGEQSGAVIRGVFDDPENISYAGQGVRVEGSSPSLFVRTDEVRQLRRGDTLTIGEENFWVDRVSPDDPENISYAGQGVRVEGSSPSLFVRTDEVRQLRRGDTLTIGEENFWVDRVSPDDGGSCHLWLGRGVPPAVNRRR